MNKLKRNNIMGKIKKIKQDRKRAEVEAQLKKMKRNRSIIRFALLFVFLALIGYGGVFGYQQADAKYKVKERVVEMWNNAKEKTKKEEKSCVKK